MLFINVSIGLAQRVFVKSVIVEEDGAILLEWGVSGGLIHSGKIERKSSLGTYDQIFIFTGDSISYKDTNVDGNSRSYTYKINLTVSSPGSPAIGIVLDNVESIYSEISNNQNISCDISWNRDAYIRATSPGDSTNPVRHQAYIYRKLPYRSGYNPIKTIDHTYVSGSTFTYADTVPSICDDTLKYYVEYQLNAGATIYRSNISKIRFSNYVGSAPSTPKWNNISVHPVLQQLNLTWESSTNSNIAGFELCEGEPCISFDTVWGNVSSYDCAKCDPAKIYNFKIRSFDGCATPTTSAWSEAQNNIVLNTVTINCPKEVNLSWNAYHNMQGDLGGYNIYAKFDGGQYNIIHKTNPDVTNYVYEVPEGISLANFYVAAINKSQAIEGKSNITTSFFSDTRDLVNILFASVTEDNRSVQFSVIVDNSVMSNSYDLYRGTDDATPVFYKKITPANNLAFQFEDNEVAAEKHIYTYYLKTTTGCSSVKTVPMRTTLIQKGDDVTLQWNPYIGWEDIQEYQVERKVVKPGTGGNPVWVPRTTVGESVLSFNDNVSSLTDDNEQIFYRVVAYNKANINITATSSVSEYIKEGAIQIPTAFTPKGMQGAANTVFKPRTSYVADQGYSFVIYSRWGEVVFQTTNPEEGWDGKYKGNFCHPGTYIYSVKCIFRTGKTGTKTGTVLVIE